MVWWPFKGLFSWRDPYFASYERALERLERDSRRLEERITKRKARKDRFQRAATVYMAMLMLPLLLLAVHAAKSPKDAFTKEERAMRIAPAVVFPVFLFVCRAVVAYFHSWSEGSDTKYLRKLRAKQRTMIDELKDRSAFDKMQALIQRYDPTVIPMPAISTPGVATPGSAGLRNRRTPSSAASPRTPATPAASGDSGASKPPPTPASQVVQKMRPLADALAAHLVGEKPEQCIALICESCHAHNGLARPEDHGNMRVYYCPKCNHLNGATPLRPADAIAGEETSGVAGGAGATSVGKGESKGESVGEEEEPELTKKDK